MLGTLKEIFMRLVRDQQMDTFRYLSASFSLDNRLTGLVGSRGVGKTTLLLQTIKQHFPTLEGVFYFSADHIYFNSSTLYEFIVHMHEYESVNIFFIDEIHKYKNWDQEIKNIYDSFKNIKIVFSGSSSLNLVKGSYDLSRRTKLYVLHGLSFREYLKLVSGLDINSISLNVLLSDPSSCANILPSIPNLKKHFTDYLHYGYYPFFLESDREIYYERILRVVEKTIYEDIAGFYRLKTNNLHFFAKILNFLSSIEPGSYSQHNLAKNLRIDDKTVAEYASILEATKLISTVKSYGGGSKLLHKVEKVFINNTTLCRAINSALGKDVPCGYMRELFFLQSIKNAGEQIFYSKVGDYQNKDFVFEIGGRNKKTGQLGNSDKQFYIVKDDILYPSKLEIPLYLFGFLY